MSLFHYCLSHFLACSCWGSLSPYIIHAIAIHKGKLITFVFIVIWHWDIFYHIFLQYCCNFWILDIYHIVMHLILHQLLHQLPISPCTTLSPIPPPHRMTHFSLIVPDTSVHLPSTFSMRLEPRSHVLTLILTTKQES